MYQLLQGQVQVYCPKRRGLREVRFLPRSNACGSTPSASLSWDRAGSRTPGPLAIPLRAFLLPFACLVALFSPWHMTDRAHPPLSDATVFASRVNPQHQFVGDELPPRRALPGRLS